MPRASKTDQTEAREMLLSLLKPGDTVYTILRHVSSTGMNRVIDLVVFTPDGPRHIAWNAARLMGDTYDNRREGIKVSGCGMDLGFSLVYNLGRTLWPDGFTCVGEASREVRYHSNDHSNGDRDYTPHHHQDGGYALQQRWL